MVSMQNKIVLSYPSYISMTNLFQFSLFFGCALYKIAFFLIKSVLCQIKSLAFLVIGGLALQSKCKIDIGTNHKTMYQIRTTVIVVHLLR